MLFPRSRNSLEMDQSQAGRKPGGQRYDRSGSGPPVQGTYKFQVMRRRGQNQRKPVSQPLPARIARGPVAVRRQGAGFAPARTELTAGGRGASLSCEPLITGRSEEHTSE